MASNAKIPTLDELVPILDRHRSDGRRIVHCHGVFDLLHVGHIRHFQQARQFGDVLVVTLTPDRFVNKGLNRPAFPETLRAEMIDGPGERPKGIRFGSSSLPSSSASLTACEPEKRSQVSQSC